MASSGIRIAQALALILVATTLWAGEDRLSKFTNRDSIANTRHNMTQRTLPGIGSAWMDASRNDYGEICVYCHTPHGAAGNIKAPLWNRTTVARSFQTYDAIGTATLTQPVSQPGGNSLTCLSCHDGQTAIDSIINMPGSGGYKAAQQNAATTDTAFLDSWAPGGNGSGDPLEHASMSAGGAGCLTCHAPGSYPGAADFRVFVIGTDLRNDHPVGVRYPPAGAGTDFQDPPLKGARIAYFKATPGTDAIRLYDTGEGYEVECASCHDPHGVPTAGPGSAFVGSFLRVSNVGSGVCLTCHAK